MTMWKITPPNARAAANMVARIRARSGGPEWHTPGIEDAFIKAADMADEPDLVIAMIRAARVPGNRTPAIILHPGPHWSGGEGPVKYPQLERHERCNECGQADGPGHPGDHPWVPALGSAAPPPVYDKPRLAEVKAELARGRQALCPHGGKTCAICDRSTPVVEVAGVEDVYLPGDVPAIVS